MITPGEWCLPGRHQGERCLPNGRPEPRRGYLLPIPRARSFGNLALRTLIFHLFLTRTLFFVSLPFALRTTFVRWG